MLRIGVVGMGGIGNTHAACHKKDSLAKLVAVCDVVKAKADEAAAKHEVKAYYSLKELLANEDLDVVDVTTGGYENGSWHFEPTMEALDAGKNVLCEKPLSNDIGEAREMVRFAASKNVYLGCNLNHYFTPPAERAKKYIDDGEMGELAYLLFKMGFHGGELTYGFNKSPRFNQPYAYMKAFLTHPLSVMRYLCGDITHVQAFCTRPGFRRNKGDLLLSLNSIHCRFANDTVGYLLSQRGDAVWAWAAGGAARSLAARARSSSRIASRNSRIGRRQSQAKFPASTAGPRRRSWTLASRISARRSRTESTRSWRM